MKQQIFKLSVALILINQFIFVNVKAQTYTYHPFPDSNAIWQEVYRDYSVCAVVLINPYTVVSVPGFEEVNYKLYIGGDIMIDSLNYKVIMSTGRISFVCRDSNVTYNWGSYTKCAGAFRQDIEKKEVYYVEPGKTTEYLLYEFDLNVGDTLRSSYINQFSDVYVDSIDSVLVDNQYRKRFNLAGGAIVTQQLIEGIGSTSGLLNPLGIGFDIVNRLICFSLNGNTVFILDTNLCELSAGIKEINKNVNTILIYPNPSNGLINLAIKSQLHENVSIEISNLNGQTVYNKIFSNTQHAQIDLSNQPKGVYFVKLISGQDVRAEKLIIQ